jgi:gliding motility-associated protein GldL
MGIISKIYNGISGPISTEKGKLISGFAYGIGASLVIIGALFKILHLKGAEEMLMIGMGAEAFLFALGAFEPPHKEYDWSMVYPQLAMGHGHGHTPSEISLPNRSEVSVATKSAVPASPKKAEMVSSLADTGELLNPGDIEKLREGLKKLGDTANQINQLSGASIATENYIRNLQNASETVEHLNSVQTKSSEVISAATENFSDSYKKVVTNFESALSDAQKNATNAIKDASSQLLTSYSGLTKSLDTNISSLNGNGKEITASLTTISGNLSKINSIYELQMNALNDQVNESKKAVSHSQQTNSSLTTIATNFAQVLADTEAYKQESGKLKKQVSDLNAVYGNMLNALNIES